MDHTTDGLVYRPHLLASGITDDELRRMRAADRLTAVRPGAYVESVDTRLIRPNVRHSMLVRATMRKVAPDAVVSHCSAAALHGLPLWRTPLDRVHVTKDRRSGGRRTTLLHVHTAALAEDDVVEIDGLFVTSVERTVADVARFEAFEPALIVADAALHRKLTTSDRLASAVGRGEHRAGNPRARRVVGFASGGAMSPGETRSRLAIHRAGLPPPQVQYRIPGTTFDVDFWWSAFRTAGEFDGLVKYGRLLKPGQSAGDAIVAEKRREDEIRSHGVKVGRWVWAELPPEFAPVVVRLRRVFEQR